MKNSGAGYSISQRLVALVYGLICHSVFLVAVATTALAFFLGMQIGRGTFHGFTAVIANSFLLFSYPIFHSWLLTPKGRRFMAKFVPLGIGANLAMTVFVIITSLQLLATFENMELLGSVDFSELSVDHACILSIPQAKTVSILEEGLKKYSSVKILKGLKFEKLTFNNDYAEVELVNIKTEEIIKLKSGFIAGCDGQRSSVRKQLEIPFPYKYYAEQFLMADFADNTDFGEEARLYFGIDGSVESFPLPDNSRRWIVQYLSKINPDKIDIGDTITKLVKKRTGHDLSASEKQFESRFRPSWCLAKSYYKGRVLLCGDAAHVMSPIGGQGMNTGFADAYSLSGLIVEAIESPKQVFSLFEYYTYIRQRAFKKASGRSASGMRMGTRRGKVLSYLRKLLRCLQNYCARQFFVF